MVPFEKEMVHAVQIVVLAITNPGNVRINPMLPIMWYVQPVGAWVTFPKIVWAKKLGPGMKVQKLPWTKNTCLSWLNWVRVQPPHPHLPLTILGVVLITAKKTNRIGVIILGVLEECLEPHQEPLDP